MLSPLLLLLLPFLLSSLLLYFLESSPLGPTSGPSLLLGHGLLAFNTDLPPFLSPSATFSMLVTAIEAAPLSGVGTQTAHQVSIGPLHRVVQQVEAVLLLGTPDLPFQGIGVAARAAIATSVVRKPTLL
jgi:hypothetical protein